MIVKAPHALLERIRDLPDMEYGKRRLVVLLSPLGDFDSLEYAQALTPELTRLQESGISTLAIGIGDPKGADQFCQFTGFDRKRMIVDAKPTLHQELGLYAGLRTPINPWPGLVLMCAGFGSPGTILEVIRGYTGDRSAPQRIDRDETIKASPLPAINGSLFANIGGEGYLRPFELATIRLRNMGEVLTNWRTYVPRDDFITQRGGTYLLDCDNTVLYSHKDKGILGFSETMARPLSFLDPYLKKSINSQDIN